MTFRRAWVAVAMAALAAAAPAAMDVPAQNPPPQQPPTFRAGTRTVMVPAVVTDESGAFVRDLTRSQFEVRDNGQVQDITFFDRQVMPIAAVMLIDGSASMLASLDDSIEAANEFILRMLPGDRLRLGSFSECDRFKLQPEFTGDRDALLGYLANEFNIRVGRRTCLWDAMGEAIAALAGTEGRRVLIVISDGVDTWSFRSFEDVRVSASRRDVAVYFARLVPLDRAGQIVEMTKGRDGTSPGQRTPMPIDAFETLARDTGGQFIRLEEQWVSQTPFTEIALDLHSQYVLGFTPRVLDNKTHEIDVRVSQRGLKVRARKSFIASEDR
jgi:Ca-activated chloride channel family protein